MRSSFHFTGLAALAVGVALAAAPSVTAQGRGPGQGGGGGGPYGGGPPVDTAAEDEGYGNNLSVPVVFPEGHGLLGLPTSEDPGVRPPGIPGAVAPFWDSSAIFLKDGVTFYPQQTTSYWRAEYTNGVSGTPEAAIVNWADNLTKQKWTAKSMVRVETVLYQNLTDTTTAYTMEYLYGKGATEMWGADATTYESIYRTVYSVCARLRIEKLSGQNGTPTGLVVIDDAVYEAFGIDGPGGYSAEVNVSGNAIYGYNWNLKQADLSTDQKVGWWRLTFSIDSACDYTIATEEGVSRSFNVSGNTQLSAVDPGDLLDEVLHKPTIVNATTSVLDIEIVERRTGRKPSDTGGGGKPPDTPGQGPKK